MARRVYGGLVLMAVLWLFGPVLAEPVHAATFVVNSGLDEPDNFPGDGICNSQPSNACTLRAAVMEANVFAGDDVITLPAGEILLNAQSDPTDDDLHGDVDVRSNVTIAGAGRSQTTIRRGIFLASPQTIEVHAAVQVRFENVTLKGAPGSFQDGLLNLGSVTFDDVEIKEFGRDGMTNASGATFTGSRVYFRDNDGRLTEAPGWGLINQGRRT